MVVKDHFKINHVLMRSNNGTAYKLVKYAVSNSRCIIWLEYLKTVVNSVKDLERSTKEMS